MAEKKKMNAAGPSRRNLLKIAGAGLVAGIAAKSLLGRSPAFAAAGRADNNILIAYYSRTGNTRDAAELIRGIVGGEIAEIRTAHSYPAEYRATTDQARKEQEAGFRPQLTTEIGNMDSFGTVFIGYPNWWGTMPMAFFTFLEKYDLGGKTLAPFCTHEGSGLGRSVSDIRKLCPDATVTEGLALRGGGSGYAKTENGQRDIADWLRKLGMTA